MRPRTHPPGPVGVLCVGGAPSTPGWHAADDSARALAARCLALAVTGYLALWAALDALPLLDLPNHLARATIIGDLWLDGGRRFGEAYVFELRFAPYILGDLALATLTQALPADVAGRLWVALLFLSLPLATLVFLRAFGFRGWQLVFGAGAAVYLATDWFFLVGFGAFRLGCALVLVGLATWRGFVERPGRGRVAAYVALVVLCYLTHFSAFVFFGFAAAWLTLRALVRGALRLPVAVALGVPFVLLGALYLSVGGGELAGASLTHPLDAKLMRLGGGFVRFAWLPDLLLCGLLAVLCVALGRARWRDARELLSLAALFLALYACMPAGSGTVYGVDLRALPFVALFTVFAALRGLAPDRAPPRVARLALAALLLGNLGYLAGGLLPRNEAARAYRAVLDQLPTGARFLPVSTRAPLGRVDALKQAHAWGVIDRGAVSPYLFRASAGDAMVYFDGRAPTPAPDLHWYREGERPMWARVAQNYRYLVVTEPFESSRIELSGRWLVQTPSASVLEVARAR